MYTLFLLWICNEEALLKRKEQGRKREMLKMVGGWAGDMSK